MVKRCKKEILLYAVLLLHITSYSQSFKAKYYNVSPSLNIREVSLMESPILNGQLDYVDAQQFPDSIKWNEIDSKSKTSIIDCWTGLYEGTDLFEIYDTLGIDNIKVFYLGKINFYNTVNSHVFLLCIKKDEYYTNRQVILTNSKNDNLTSVLRMSYRIWAMGYGSIDVSTIENTYVSVGIPPRRRYITFRQKMLNKISKKAKKKYISQYVDCLQITEDGFIKKFNSAE